MYTTTEPRRAQQRWVPGTVGTRPSGTDRVGDRDRAAAASVLGRAWGAGYLDVLEYEDRLRRVLEARTGDDLGRFTADLPASVLRDPEHLRRAARFAVRLHAAAALVGVLVCWVVWLSVGLGAGAWSPWPLWPTLGGGLAVAGHAATWRAVLAAAR